MSLPCGVDDVEEIRVALGSHPGIEVRDVAVGITVSAAAAADAGAGKFSFDYDEMERP